jgi:hypothetical protein
MLVELIDTLIEDSSGLNLGTIRNRLLVLREQAEAIEAELQKAQARIKELEAHPQSQDRGDEYSGLEEGAKKILQLLFNAGGRLSIEQMAGTLGLTESMAQYHADGLMHSQGMIEVVAWTPAGTMFMLTAKGRAYVVRNNLA